MVNNNDLDRNPPIVSEVCDTPITNNHGGTNTPTQWIDAIAWWRPALCGRNVVINIKVTIVRQTIKLNPLYTLSTMINIFHYDKYITLCNFGDRNMTQLIVWRVQLTLTLKMTVFRSRLTPSITANTRFLEEDVVLFGYHVPATVSVKVFIPILLISFFQISCFHHHS